MATHKRRQSRPRSRTKPPVRREIRIDHLGHRGDGVAVMDAGRIFVPATLAGEHVTADVAGDRAHLIEILTPSPDRITPICPVFDRCGGCSVQHMAGSAYQAWKRTIVATALENRGLDGTIVSALVDAHGDGRRRVTVHAERSGGTVHVGFAERRGRTIVATQSCPVLSPDLGPVFAIARALAETVPNIRRRFDLQATATDTGLDLDVRGVDADTLATREALAAIAGRFDPARLCATGEVVAERRRPRMTMGSASVTPPPGGFLQATAAGEAALAERVLAALPKDGPIADLFCGVGTFALRLAVRQPVRAVDGDAPALAALDRAVRETPGLKPVTIDRRDLFYSPISARQLTDAAGVVFDPPRAGAEAQAHELAGCAVPVIVAVSCEPATFARDAAILTAGGYVLESVTPIDQFRYTAHVEIVGVFRKP